MGIPPYQACYSADMKKLHSEFSDISWQSYPQWAETQNWQFLE
jgi:hypothetical protein